MAHIGSLIGLLVCLSVGIVGSHCLLWDSSSHTQILDQRADSDVVGLAEAVCESKSSDKQISRIDTPARILAYLEKLSSNHPLADCKQKYVDSLRALVKVLETGNEDACGSKKLARVEYYHKLYVSQVRKHKMDRDMYRSDAPKLLRIFFMHYASMLSSLCERSAVASMSNLGHSPKLAESVEKMAEEFASKLGLTDLAHGYDSIFLPWSLIESLYLKKDGDTLSRCLFPSESIKMNIKVQKDPGLKQIKAACRDHLRPTYARTLLPVLRLVDMGYYPESGQLAKKLQSEPVVRQLYASVQICELVLPVRVVLDEKGRPGDITLLTKQEAEELTAREAEPEMNDGAPLSPSQLVSLRSLQVLSTVTEKSAYKMSKQMCSIIKNRGKTIMKVAKLYMKNLRKRSSDLESKLDAMRFSEDGSFIGQTFQQHLHQPESQEPQVEVYDE